MRTRRRGYLARKLGADLDMSTRLMGLSLVGLGRAIDNFRITQVMSIALLHWSVGMLDSVGRKMRALREGRGLSQEAVARMIGVKKQTVSQWERGGAQPRVAHLVALAELYELAPSEIYDGAEIPPETLQSVGARLATVAQPLPILSPKDAAVVLSGAEGHEACRRFGATCFPAPHDAVFVEIDDDANSPRWMIEDLVAIAPREQPLPGKMVLALVGDRPLFRRLLPLLPDTLAGATLQPENPRWPKATLGATDRVLGVMIEHVTRHHG